MSRKSDTCFNKLNGRPLSEYYSKSEALESASYTKRKFGQNLIPYKCDSCGFWHLSPKNRQTPSTTCKYCTDRNGNYKELYQSKSDAEKRAKILARENHVKLKVYQCPYSDGWHLTKK